LKHVWISLRDRIAEITVEDPANPTGNNLAELFNESVQLELSSAAARTLELIEREGWEKVFGPMPGKPSAPAILPGFTVRPRGSFGE
jgi:hypothetical protein